MITHKIKYGSELHKKIAEACRLRVEAAKKARESAAKRWDEAERRAFAYLPEREADRARRQEREAGKPQYTTIQVPYTYAMLMSAHAYLSSVFLGRTPIFQFAGRHGEGEMKIQAIEALINYQMTTGENIPALFIWLYDALKYGEGILGLHWEEDIYVVGELRQDGRKIGKLTREVTGYRGNKLSNIRPHDFYPDPRVPLREFQRGEFCAVLNPAVSLNKLKDLAARGFYVNVERLKNKGQSLAREQGSEVVELPRNEDAQFLGADAVEIFEIYIELIPSEWGLGSGTRPEKWVFTTSGDFGVVLGARPLGAFHNKFPFDVLLYEPEGYMTHPRSLPEIIKPMQDTIDWLINAHFYNVRKVLNNQFIVDPSMVEMKDFENSLPGGIIRLAPAGYGRGVDVALRQIPVSDVTRQHMSDLAIMMQVGERMTGINEMVQGLSTPSSRRSAAEIRSTTSFAVGRLKTVAEYFSATGFAPLATKMVQNSQQYYDERLKLRIVGDLAQTSGPEFIEVDADSISGFYDFVPVDGTLPADRFAQAALWAQLFAQLKQFPQVMARYDVAKIFAWVAQLTGLKNIEQFKVEVAPDDVLQSQAQAGNVAPMKGNPLTPRQIPGMGQAG